MALLSIGGGSRGVPQSRVNLHLVLVLVVSTVSGAHDAGTRCLQYRDGDGSLQLSKVFIGSFQSCGIGVGVVVRVGLKRGMMGITKAAVVSQSQSERSKCRLIVILT